MSMHCELMKPQHIPTPLEPWSPQALLCGPPVQADGTHMRFWQNVPFGQLMMQLVLGAGGMQTVWPVKMVPWQKPLHVVPQTPQFAGSCVVSAQVP